MAGFAAGLGQEDRATLARTAVEMLGPAPAPLVRRVLLLSGTSPG